jgi:hypothetical protein
MKSVENEWEQVVMKDAAAPKAAKHNSPMTETTVNAGSQE